VRPADLQTPRRLTRPSNQRVAVSRAREFSERSRASVRTVVLCPLSCTDFRAKRVWHDSMRTEAAAPTSARLGSIARRFLSVSCELLQPARPRRFGPSAITRWTRHVAATKGRSPWRRPHRPVRCKHVEISWRGWLGKIIARRDHKAALPRSDAGGFLVSVQEASGDAGRLRNTGPVPRGKNQQKKTLRPRRGSLRMPDAR